MVSPAERLAAGWQTLAYHLAALAVAAGLAFAVRPPALPPLAPLALLPVALAAAWKVAFRREEPLDIAAIGLREAAHTVLFVALAIPAFR